MSRVVLLSWDPSCGTLEYVQVNGGAGGELERLEVGEPSAADVTETLAGVALPRLAELVIDDDDVLLGDFGAPAVRCTVWQAGSPGDRRFRLIPKGRVQR